MANTDVPRRFPRDFSSDDINLFLGLFTGRDKGFAEYTLFSELEAAQPASIPTTQKSKINIIYRPAPLDGNIATAHLKGEKTLGYFPIREDLTVSAIILSYTMGKVDVVHADYQRSLMVSAACNQVTLLHNHHVPAVLEDFSEFSLRVWIFLQEFVHFLEARKIAQKLVDALGVSKPGVHLSPFLFTEADGLDWAEKAVSLPLGKEAATGRRSLFLDHSTGRHHQDQVAFLRLIQRVGIATIKEFIRKRNESYFVPKQKRLQPESAHAKLQAACTVFDYLIKKAMSGRNLTEQEKKAVFYTAGFFDTDRKALHEIFRHCPNYREKSVERQAANIYPRPISCIKLRELLPHVVSDLECSCIFSQHGLELGRYPSPMLHIDPRLVPTVDERYTCDYSLPREMAQKYASLSQEISALNEQKTLLERELKIALSRSGKTEIKAGSITLSISDDGELEVLIK